MLTVKSYLVGACVASRLLQVVCSYFNHDNNEYTALLLLLNKQIISKR